MVRKIVRVRDKRLRIRSKKIRKIDKKTKLLVKDLKDTLKAQVNPDGVGLAAPQIGKNVRVFVTYYKKNLRVFINPKILSVPPKNKGQVKKTAVKTTKKKSVSSRKIMEGCLSLPNFYGPLQRSFKLKVKYQNEKGEIKSASFEGFEAQIIQHEIDHLNGVLFIDRLLEQDKPLYELVNGQWQEVEL